MRIECPYCGPRDETEFVYGGEAHISRPVPEADDVAWSDYLFMRDNVKGIHAERWCHRAGCRQWFNALRDTATHRFITVYRLTEERPCVMNAGER